MSALPLILLTQFALACPAASAFPPGRVVDRVTATAQAESSLQTTALHDNSSNRTYAPTTVAEAVQLVATLHAQGHSLDAGVMQVNDSNWQRLGLTAETVFDPRSNVCAGMTVLAEAYAIERRVSCRYNTGFPDCRNGYPEKINQALAQLKQGGGVAVPAAASPSAASQGPPPPPSWDVWAQADYLEAQAAAAQTAFPATLDDVPPETSSASPLIPANPRFEARPVAAAPVPDTAADEGASAVAMVSGTPVRQ